MCGNKMSEGMDVLDEMDLFWYERLRPVLPSGVLRAMGRFGYGIAKDMVRLSLMGFQEFPEASRGYVLEKVLSIIRRARIEKDVLKELMRYMDDEEIEEIRKEVRLNQGPLL
ncbi:MAG: hypothetical protein DRJ41_03285 [Thermoprotei archaeon]|nr:MAG: hypothetical protein DRJ41_03285 [Thermoprotei archaeon]